MLNILIILTLSFNDMLHINDIHFMVFELAFKSLKLLNKFFEPYLN